MAGIYEIVWGAAVAFIGVVALKIVTASGLGSDFARVVLATYALSGVLMLISGLWLIWRARWARWLGLISTVIVVFVSLVFRDVLGLFISLGLVLVLGFAALRG